MSNPIDVALSPVRETLQADGADLEIKSVTENELVVEITVNDQTCIDCLLPEAITYPIIKDKLKENGITFEKIKIIYPTANQ